MAELKNETLGVRLTVPDKIDVRHQLAFYGCLRTDPAEMFEASWEAAKTMILEWECADFPDRNENLGEIVDPKVARIVIWVGGEVSRYISRLEAPSPN